MSHSIYCPQNGWEGGSSPLGAPHPPWLGSSLPASPPLSELSSEGQWDWGAPRAPGPGGRGDPSQREGLVAEPPHVPPGAGRGQEGLKFLVMPGSSIQFAKRKCSAKGPGCLGASLSSHAEALHPQLNLEPLLCCPGSHFLPAEVGEPPSPTIPGARSPSCLLPKKPLLILGLGHTSRNSHQQPNSQGSGAPFSTSSPHTWGFKNVLDSRALS